MDVQLDATAAHRFISSLSKSLQALCHGCMDFDSGIEIVGYINVNIDSGSKVDYVLNEKMTKSNTNSMTFISNSFLAKKDVPKQTRDGACSPVAELQLVQRSPYKSSYHTHGPRLSMQFPHSHRGSQKRTWPHVDRDWRGGPKRHRGGHMSHSSSQQQHMVHTPTQQHPASPHHAPPTSVLSSSENTAIDAHQALANVKQELIDSNGSENKKSSGASSENPGQSSQSAAVDVKQDPEASATSKPETESEDQTENTEQDNLNPDLAGTFLGQSAESGANKTPAAQQTTGLSDSSAWPEEGDSSHMSAVDVPSGSGDYTETGEDSYYQDPAEGSSDAAQFEVIEIGDEEEIQGLFGDSGPPMARAGINGAYFARGREGRGQDPAQTWCSVCGQDMGTLFLLRQHMSAQHGDRLPYRCRMCDRGFISSSGLRHHIRSSHSGVVFTCEVCGSKFKHKHHMYDHMRRQHNIMPSSSMNKYPKV